MRGIQNLAKGILPPLVLFVLVGCTNAFESVNNQSRSSESVEDPPGPNQVAVLVAQGHMGRTLISCNDGQSWIHDQSDNNNARCGTVDCENSASAGRGLDYGDGWFYANFGWGTNGSLRRSADGINWEVINSNNWGPGVTYVDGALLWIAGNDWPLSINGGLNWVGSLLGLPIANFSARNYSRFGRTIVVSGEGSSAVISHNGGRTWSRSDLFGTDWSTVQIAEGFGQLMSLSHKTEGGMTTAYIAESRNNGANWIGKTQYQGEEPRVWQNLFFDGRNFVTWFDNQQWKSNDVEHWAKVNVRMTGTAFSGPIGRSRSGRYVAIPNNATNVYENQKAYRSTDGITWTMLTTAQFQGGHPITKIVSGYVDRSVCQ